MDLSSSKLDDSPSSIKKFRRVDWIFLIAGTTVAITVGLSGKWVIRLGIVVFIAARWFHIAKGAVFHL